MWKCETLQWTVVKTYKNDRKLSVTKFQKTELTCPCPWTCTRNMLTSLAAGKIVTQANTGYQILSDMEEAWKTTIPKNPAFDYTYVNENILAKVKKVMFGGKLLIQPEKSSLKKTIKVHSSVIRGW